MPVLCLQNRVVSPSPAASHLTGRTAPRPVSLPGARPASHVARALSKTPHDWHDKLTVSAPKVHANGVETTELKQRLASDDWVLVDVRPTSGFAAGHAKGAVNIPLFDKPQNPGNKDMIKRFLLRMNDVAYLDYNEGFVDAIKAAAGHAKEGGNKGLVFIDDNGGRLVREYRGDRGRESRALKALYIAIEAGLTRVDFVQGGLRNSAAQGLPYVGDVDGRAKAS